MLERLFKVLSSLKLTVVCLGVAIVLVFIGTLAQVDEGLYQAQTRYFRSFLIYWSPPGAHWKIPVFPGGYLLGTVLLANLLAAHLSRFKLTRKKLGIHLIHGGLILLLLGQLLTDALSTESAMQLAEGEAKNYSQDFRDNELVIIDTTDPQRDRVTSIPESLVARKIEIAPSDLPLKVHVLDYWANSSLFETATGNAVPIKTSQGIASKTNVFVLPLKSTTDPNQRDIPSALVQMIAPQGPLGPWLVRG